MVGKKKKNHLLKYCTFSSIPSRKSRCNFGILGHPCEKCALYTTIPYVTAANAKARR